MISASEYVAPETVFDMVWSMGSPMREKTDLGSWYSDDRLHWQPSTALQAVGTGAIISRSLYAWIMRYAANVAHGWASLDHARQSALIGFGAK